MFTFAHPGLLWLLPLTAVPAALHLLSRLRPAPLRFPPLRFLRPSPMPLQGRRRWQDLLLMALRTLLVALAVLLAAGPEVRRNSDAPGERESGIAVILDSSASMEPSLTELRPEAMALSGANAAFWNTAGEPVSPAEWRAGFSSARPATVLGTAYDWLRQYPEGRREVHLFSDLQEGEWDGALPALPPGTRLFVHGPAKTVNANCGITGVAAEALSQGELRLLVQYRNWGDRPEKRQLAVTLDGKTSRQEVVMLPHALGMASLLVAQPQDPHASLALEPSDDFSFDDRWLFWARGEEPHPVLAVFSDEDEDEELSSELEAVCVSALTSEPQGAVSRYTVSVVDTFGLALADLSDIAAVYLWGAADRLDDETLGRLADYAAQGGVLVTVPGNSPVAGWRGLQRAGLAPQGSALLEHRPTGIGSVPETSPFYSLFPPKAPSDLHLFPIRRFLRITGGAEQSLLQTLEGTPALLQKDLGKGKAYLFLFGFDHEASDFPLTRSFLPLLRELSDRALAGRPETLRLSCGEEMPALKDLSGETLDSGVLPDTSKPGLFLYGAHRVEINPPPWESVPRYLAPQEVERSLKRAPLRETSAASVGDSAAGRLRAWGACALAFLMLAEAFLAKGGISSRRTGRQLDTV